MVSDSRMEVYNHSILLLMMETAAGAKSSKIWFILSFQLIAALYTFRSSNENAMYNSYQLFPHASCGVSYIGMWDGSDISCPRQTSIIWLSTLNFLLMLQFREDDSWELIEEIRKRNWWRRRESNLKSNMWLFLCKFREINNQLIRLSNSRLPTPVALKFPQSL